MTHFKKEINVSPYYTEYVVFEPTLTHKNDVMYLKSFAKDRRYSDSSFLSVCFALTVKGGNTDGGARTVVGSASFPRPMPSNSVLNERPEIKQNKYIFFTSPFCCQSFLRK